MNRNRKQDISAIVKIFSAIIAFDVWSQEPLPIGPESALPEVREQQLQFSRESMHYFKEELSLQESSLPTKTEESEVSIQLVSLCDGAWEFVFSFPEPVSFTEKKAGDTLYLEFNQAFDSKDLPKVQEDLSYLMKRIAEGTHSLLFDAARPVSYCSATSGNLFFLTIVPKAVPLSRTEDQKIAAARQEIEKRHFAKAEEMLNQLSIEYPESRDIPINYANLYGLRSEWKKEANLLSELETKFPYDDNLKRLYTACVGPHSSFLRLERQLQDTYKTAAVHVNRAQGEAIVRNSPRNTTYLGAEYQLWRGNVYSISNPQGLDVSFLGTRQRGTVYARGEWEGGARFSGFFYAQEMAVFGLGAETALLWPLIQGDFTARIDWQKPCWEVFEALAYHGRENRIYFNLNGVVNRYANWRAGAGARRVGITDVPNGYTSVIASAEIFFNLWIRNPVVAFNYGYDAEYVEQIKEEIGVDGTVFNPVPLTTFEFHSLRGYFFYTWREYWHFTAFAGETFNRFGIRSTTFGFDILYSNPKYLDVDCSLAQFPSQTTPGTNSLYVTATLTGRF